MVADPAAARAMLDAGRRALRYLLALALALLAIYVAGFGVAGLDGFVRFDEIDVRGLTVGTAILIVLLGVAMPADTPIRFAGVARLVVNVALMAITIVAVATAIAVVLEQEFAFIDIAETDIFVGVLGIAVLLEITRRMFGWALFIVCVVFVAYALVGQDLPWIFRHGGFSLRKVVEVLWFQDDGVWGRPVAVVSQLVLIFIVFGVILEHAGAGRVILKIAFAATGRLIGGPAHAAIVASGLFGTLSGSVVANVVSTGVFTIPTIRRYGFAGRFAGGVEAAASTGGQIVPPVMGIVAFLIADTINVPYLTVAAAAIVPAALFYASLFAAVVIEARRAGLAPVPETERERLTARDWLHSLIFLIPLAIIVAILIEGRSPAQAGFWAVLAAIALGVALNPDFRSPRRLVDALAGAGQTCATIMIVVAAVGVIIGVVSLTGVGQRFAEAILELIGTNLFSAMVLVMLGCLLLGMGMPTGAAYLTVVAVLGPVLVKLGIPLLAAHLFMAYFAVLSAVTPPVAIGAFAAAPIAGARMMATAIDAVRLSVAGFIIPFVFAFNPGVLLVEAFEVGPFVWIVARTLAAIWLIATALGGFERAALPIWSRAGRIVVSVALLWTGDAVAIGGAVAGVALIVLEALHRRQRAG